LEARTVASMCLSDYKPSARSPLRPWAPGIFRLVLLLVISDTVELRSETEQLKILLQG
ncbi:hypothetical protein AVEN_196469-1, partial [Araneus ventricosus]